MPGSESEQDASGGLRFPQFVTLGYSFRPAPGWNLEIGAVWTDWNPLNELTVHGQGADMVSVPFHWRSNWLYAAGITRAWESGWRASLGCICAEDVVPDAMFMPAVPGYDRCVLPSAGYSGERWGFDVAYQYSHQPSRSIKQGTVVDGTCTLDTHAVPVSCGLKF